MVLVVGVTGLARSGKDTVAKVFEAEGFVNYKFAAPLKEAVRAMFGFAEEQMETTKDAVDDRWGISPRQAMQFLGTEVMQFDVQRLLPGIGRGFWARSLVERVRSDGCQRVVISDLRFRHEVEELRAAFGPDNIRLFKVVRPGLMVMNHMSEQEINHIDAQVTLYNTGTLEALQEATRNIARSICDEVAHGQIFLR